MQPTLQTDIETNGSGLVTPDFAPWLRLVLRRPGAVYQPLMFASLADEGPLEQDLARIAETEGVRVAKGIVQAMDIVRLEDRLPSVVLLNDSELVAWRDAEASVLASPSTCQSVVWTRTRVADLPADIRAWVDERGILIDSTLLCTRRHDPEWTLGSLFDRCGKSTGSAHNPVVLVAPNAETAYASAEASIRLQAAGFRSVFELGAVTDVPSQTLRAAARGNALILEIVDAEDVLYCSVLESLGQCASAGCQIVVVASDDSIGVLMASTQWSAFFSNGVTVAVKRDDESTLADLVRSVDEQTIAAWPSVDRLLVGGPAIPSAPLRALAGVAGSNTNIDTSGQRAHSTVGHAAPQHAMSLSNPIQMVALQQTSGRLLVYSATALGTITFVRGEITDAQITGDQRTSEDLRAAAGRNDLDATYVVDDLIIERIFQMSMWPQAQFVLLPDSGTPQSTSRSLGIDSLLIEIARRTDVAPLRQSRIGDSGEVWVRVAPDSLNAHQPPSGGPLATLWMALDGYKTVSAAARELGLLENAALDMIDSLASVGVIRRLGPPRAFDAPMGSAEVAAALLNEGLDREATHVLEAAAQQGGMSYTGWSLLGHLVASNDQRSALSHFSEALHLLRGMRDPGAAGGGRNGGMNADTSTERDLLINIGLLLARCHSADPVGTWARIAKWLQSNNETLPTGKHYGICGELALRAGDLANAQRAADALGMLGDAESAAFAQVLTAVKEHVAAH